MEEKRIQTLGEFVEKCQRLEQSGDKQALLRFILIFARHMQKLETRENQMPNTFLPWISAAIAAQPNYYPSMLKYYDANHYATLYTDVTIHQRALLELTFKRLRQAKYKLDDERKFLTALNDKSKGRREQLNAIREKHFNVIEEHILPQSSSKGLLEPKICVLRQYALAFAHLVSWAAENDVEWLAANKPVLWRELSRVEAFVKLSFSEAVAKSRCRTVAWARQHSPPVQHWASLERDLSCLGALLSPSPLHVAPDHPALCTLMRHKKAIEDANQDTTYLLVFTMVVVLIIAALAFEKAPNWILWITGGVGALAALYRQAGHYLAQQERLVFHERVFDAQIKPGCTEVGNFLAAAILRRDTDAFQSVTSEQDEKALWDSIPNVDGFFDAHPADREEAPKWMRLPRWIMNPGIRNVWQGKDVQEADWESVRCYVASNPKDPQILVLLARLDCRDGHYALAKEKLDQHIAQHGEQWWLPEEFYQEVLAKAKLEKPSPAPVATVADTPVINLSL